MKLRLRRPVPTARRSALAVVTAAATLGLAGCSVFSPAVVLQPYQPSDGLGGAIGGLDLRNVLVIASDVDEPGVLTAVVVNASDEPATVSVSIDVDAGEPAAQSFFVDARTSLRLGDPGAVAEDDAADDAGRGSQLGWVQVPQIPVSPGETVPVTFRVGGESQTIEAPVHLPCFEYATITPTAPAAEPTAAATPSSSVTCGPVPGETPDAEQE